MFCESPELAQLSQKQQINYQETLSERYAQVPAYLREEPLWSPYVHDVDTYDNLIDTQLALQRGLIALHQAMPEDVRLQRLLYPRLSQDTLEQFDELRGIPLSAQLIRPDYIMDQTGLPRVCEINTRFIFNGNIASIHMAEFLSAKFAVNTRPYEQLDSYMHGTYDGPGKTVLARGDEPNHDLLLQAQRCESALTVQPEVLDILDARRIGRVVLELHQHELDKVIGAVARLMIEGVAVYNDPRVIAFLHDKRLLVPLSDKAYMSPLIGDESAATLERHIIPSYHPNWEGREPETMLGKMALVKKAIGGKSQGMRMARLSEYRRQLNHPEAYVYQPRIRQPVVKTKQGPVEIAGTLPMTLEGEVFGPGIVRILPHTRLKGFCGFTIATKEIVHEC